MLAIPALAMVSLKQKELSPKALQGVSSIKITHTRRVNAVEILLKHPAPIGHQSRLIGTCSFAGEGAGALSNIDIIGHIAELLREASGTVTGVEEGILSGTHSWWCH